jgi:hypothetical protein
VTPKKEGGRREKGERDQQSYIGRKKSRSKLPHSKKEVW